MHLCRLLSKLSLVASLLSLLPAQAWAFEPEEVPLDFRGTFVSCMSKGEQDPVAGRDYAEQWLVSDAGGSAYAFYCLAIWTYRTGDPKRAGELVLKVAQDGVIREDKALQTRFYALSGTLFDEAGELREAFRSHTRALDLNRFDPSLWVNRALVRAALGDFEGTVEDLSLALALDKENLDALVFRGSSFLRVGDLERAADDALQALLIAPFEPKALWLRAQIAAEQGDLELARADLERILDKGEGPIRARAIEAVRALDEAVQKSTLE